MDPKSNDKASQELFLYYEDEYTRSWKYTYSLLRSWKYDTKNPGKTNNTDADDDPKMTPGLPQG